MTIVTLLKLAVAAGVIAFASWLSQKRPELAGFIIALPLASLIALALGHVQHGETEKSILFAKSILVGVPVSYLFFLPFFLPTVAKQGFWATYGIGIALLGLGYLVHRQIISWMA